MSNWFAYDGGGSIGTVSAEGGVILRDEEHAAGARLTLKRASNYVSVSCSISGWMDHTRFFGTVTEAQREYLLMKPLLAHMVENILSAGESDLKMWEAIADFVRRFP
ncbi:hypothetical protein ANAEL_00290 [Anaerolineales bacterium]|nr:hypothetical protein ANAEL_00290 [Anaerolineales bacterium]